jgi:hypothetical protein
VLEGIVEDAGGTPAEVRHEGLQGRALTPRANEQHPDSVDLGVQVAEPPRPEDDAPRQAIVNKIQRFSPSD